MNQTKFNTTNEYHLYILWGYSKYLNMTNKINWDESHRREILEYQYRFILSLKNVFNIKFGKRLNYVGFLNNLDRYANERGWDIDDSPFFINENVSIEDCLTDIEN